MNAPVIAPRSKASPNAAKPTAIRHSPDQGHNLPVSTKLPKGVITIGIGGYAGILVAFWIAFGGTTESAFVLVIASSFALMYFGLPLLMSRAATKQRAYREWPQSISDFLTRDFDMFTGRVSGWSALVQYAFLPIALAVGALAIGVIFIFLR
jgi:hypothetical protein